MTQDHPPDDFDPSQQHDAIALPSLDELIAASCALLPQFRTLSAEDLLTLARHLRILSNFDDAWAARGTADE
jgi:hypothetical protein